MSREKVLLVEDNDAVALGLQYALEGDDYEVFRAANANQARVLTAEDKFDLLILDIRLPDGNRMVNSSLSVIGK
jgi:DNA-binding response OmpR family regulator